MKKGDFCSFPEFGIFKEAVPDDNSNALFAPLGMTVARAVRGGGEEASPLIQSTMSVQKCSADVGQTDSVIAASRPSFFAFG